MWTPPMLDLRFNSDPLGSCQVLYYLAGLTCTEDTGAQKGGFLKDASEHGLAIVFPDTSPRGAGIQGEEDDWVRTSRMKGSRLILTYA